MNPTTTVLNKAAESAASTFLFTWMFWSKVFQRVAATAFIVVVVGALALAHLIVYGIHGLQHAL